MTREDIFLDLFGKIDDKFVLDALPDSKGSESEPEEENSALRKSAVAVPTEENIEITRKDLRIYWTTRILGAAAAIALVGAGVFLLWKNWDKIAVSGNDRPGTVTSTIEAPVVTEAVTTAESTTTPDINDVINDIIDEYESAWDWGIYAGITNKSRYGLTYYVSRSESLDERYWGDVRYSDAYIVEKFDNYKWNNVITQSDDMLENTLPKGTTNEHEIKFGQRLEPGKYRLLLFFDKFEKGAVTPEIAKMYLEFEIHPLTQTFDVKYYYLNDLAGIAAGYAPPFQSSVYDMYADSAGWQWLGYADCKGFFTSDHDKFPNEVPTELVDILRNYADGDDLKPDLGGYHEPITEWYNILSGDTAHQFEDGVSAYRFNCGNDHDYLVEISVENCESYVTVFRENKKYTAARKIMELLWDNYGENFDVFAVLDSNNGERVEYLMIVASENFFVIGEEERYNVLERVKSLLAEHDMLDDDLIKFMSPEQFRDTWIPVEIIDDTGRLNGDMIRVADRVFRLVNAENMEFDEYKKFLADNGVITPDASRETVFNLGEAVTPYRDIFDILDIQACDDYDMWHYGQITDEIIHSTAISVDTNNVWVYDKALSQAVWKTVHLRCLQELCPQIKKIDLVVGSEPDEYRIIVHADASDQELLKNDEAFLMFYDPELVEFEE